jgi:hypothetical protein
MAIIDDPEQHEAAALARMVPSFAGRHVVEVGCGDGRLTRKYVRGAAHVIAIDTHAEGITELRGNCRLWTRASLASTTWCCRCIASTSQSSPGRCDESPLRAWSMP